VISLLHLVVLERRSSAAMLHRYPAQTNKSGRPGLLSCLPSPLPSVHPWIPRHISIQRYNRTNNAAGGRNSYTYPIDTISIRIMVNEPWKRPGTKAQGVNGLKFSTSGQLAPDNSQSATGETTGIVHGLRQQLGGHEWD
jgi:hypothetical protein